MPSRTTAKTSSGKRKWARTIKTDSTHPPEGTFTKSGEEVARIMKRKSVSPGGIGSAIKMVQMFINRGGKKLSAARKRELEKAKRILQEENDA
jgi:tRNA(adenine34) deaminase